MIPLTITANLDLNPWTDLQAPGVIHAQGIVTRVGLLPAGMSSGRASVGIVVELSDGRVIVAETSWRLFESAARALAASPVAEMEDL